MCTAFEQEMNGMPEYDVFLNHNHADKSSTEDLSRRLVQICIQPWLD